MVELAAYLEKRPADAARVALVLYGDETYAQLAALKVHTYKLALGVCYDRELRIWASVLVQGVDAAVLLVKIKPTLSRLHATRRIVEALKLHHLKLPMVHYYEAAKSEVTL
jgi:hypothetical protein